MFHYYAGSNARHFIGQPTGRYVLFVTQRDFTIFDLGLPRFAGPDLQVRRGIANGALGAFAGCDQTYSVNIHLQN